MYIDNIMIMRTTITITSKGQTTLPADVRRKFGLPKQGGVLSVRFNEDKGELIISKPTSVSDLSNRISGYIRPGTTPITDVGGYYQKHREAKR